MAVVSRYDSRFAVIDQIVSHLFEPDNRRLQAWIDKIDGQNREAHNDQTLLGFTHMGRYFRPSHLAGAEPIGKKLIHSNLNPTIEAYLADERLVEDDKAMIRQGLSLLLDPCKDMQEVRDALPECLVDFLPELKEFERMSSELFTIEDNPRALKNFNKIRPKIDSYAVARLMF